ncbi:TetR/AcrR family transcriptional regulator [Aequorivita sp. H23M31]|uniref:TetR/AcrR family transcriptional regulator n=1 Tax=Aequorivita ciconiae TaxID=2494375 RepID=A0A410G1R5_9FLAO|nr:TetR family transcriptional regulator C-terminal domain-containing protein [Aequorivita sp. H23M31]QAA81179.1 TetR/AcrR family transcriptional regulator [Aequorivita sp. H23M31]
MHSSEKRTSKGSTIILSSKSLISLYVEQVLNQKEIPSRVHQFCYDHKINEAEFYAFFGSFEGIQLEIWNVFFKETMDLLETDPALSTYSDREKTIAFFHSFFQILAQHRDYILFALREYKEDLRDVRQLKSLRMHLKSFAEKLVRAEGNDQNQKDPRMSGTIFAEGFWLQTLFLLKYWMNDDSKDYTNTLNAIENSVHAIFDVFRSSPSEGVLDFGSLPWKKTGA